MNKHLSAEARKKFFEAFMDYRDSAPVYNRDDCLPGILMLSRMVGEGHSVIRDMHQVVRAKRMDKYEVAQTLVGLGFDHMDYAGTLCFFQFQGRCTSGPELYLEYKHAESKFKIYGEPIAVKKIKAQLGELFADSHRQVDLAWEVSANQGLSTTPRTIDKDLDYHQSFFPFLQKPLRDYFNEFRASKANVILLIGPPGTGKTSFVRSLIHFTGMKTLMAYNADVISSPHLYQKVRESDYELLALEDADTMMAPREGGNVFMSELLNDTQGIANSSNMKIVISTNLASLSKVDPALIRAGRCFAVLQFRALNGAEAFQVREDLDLPERDFSAKSEWTLSEVLNQQLTNERGAAVRATSTGFGNGVASPRDLLAA